MYIILSQRKDIEIAYSDELYKVYHFPARYKNQISTGDIFVYYQGDRFDRTHRVYFGTGTVGRIYTNDGDSYYAELHDCYAFEKEIPIYLKNDEGYVEQFDYETIRKSPNPPWQSSIRPLSEKAYQYIVSNAGNMTSIGKNISIEQLKNNLKDAIKGYYLRDEINKLREVVDIANQILEASDRKESSCNEKTKTVDCIQALIDYCRSMKMSYSYKPVLILGLLNSDSFSMSLDEAATFFRNFYEERRKNGQKVEKQNCVYQHENVSDEIIANNIQANPIKALLKSGYFEYIPNNKEFLIRKDIAKRMTQDDVKTLESICYQKLYRYFSSLGQ